MGVTCAGAARPVVGTTVVDASGYGSNGAIGPRAQGRGVRRRVGQVRAEHQHAGSVDTIRLAVLIGSAASSMRASAGRSSGARSCTARRAPRRSPAAAASARGGRSRGWRAAASSRASRRRAALVPRERGARSASSCGAAAARGRLHAASSSGGTRQVARELEADLLEHLQVAARDGVAGPLDGVERRVSRPSAARAGCRVEQTAPQQPRHERRSGAGAARRAEPRAGLLEQVLAADRPPRLARGPGRERAPVRAARRSASRGGQARVART